MAFNNQQVYTPYSLILNSVLVARIWICCSILQQNFWLNVYAWVRLDCDKDAN